jgi:hypothetical protein
MSFCNVAAIIPEITCLSKVRLPNTGDFPGKAPVYSLKSKTKALDFCPKPLHF